VLDVADGKLEGTILVIPLKLEESPIAERLTRLQWLSWSGGAGYEKLRLALASRAHQLSSQEQH
jgi:hypothetical protein